MGCTCDHCGYLSKKIMAWAPEGEGERLARTRPVKEYRRNVRYSHGHESSWKGSTKVKKQWDRRRHPKKK